MASPAEHDGLGVHKAMFFFIGGVQPRTIVLEDSARICPSCGLAQARLKRIDHYLSLFFIPLFPVKRGEPVLMCDRCGAMSLPDRPHEDLQPAGRRLMACRRCGRSLEPSFHYCPHCGADVKEGG